MHLRKAVEVKAALESLVPIREGPVTLVFLFVTVSRRDSTTDSMCRFEASCATECFPLVPKSAFCFVIQLIQLWLSQNKATIAGRLES